MQLKFPFNQQTGVNDEAQPNAENRGAKESANQRAHILLVALVALAALLWFTLSQLSETHVGRENGLDRLGIQCREHYREDACGELARIALNEENSSARNTAVAKLSDQSLLERIALEANDPSVRSDAAMKLTSQFSLEKIALESTDASLRGAVVAKLTSGPVLGKIALEDKDAGIRSVALARLTGPLPANTKLTDKSVRAVISDILEGQDIVDLLQERKIAIQAQGNGIEQVSVRIRRLVPYPVTVRIPVGSFFISSDRSAQNMVTTAESKVQLTTGEWIPVSPAAACANRPKHIPSTGDTFTVLRSPHQEELAKLMPVLESAQVDTKTRQAAVWIVTDNANYDDLGILVASQSGFGGFRVINEQETARAMKICDEAGIDIKKKTIWKDRRDVISGLPNGDLKTWLENKK